MNKPKSPTIRMIALVGLTALYFLGGKFGLSLAFLNSSVSPVWPPTGMALAAMLLLGNWVWPAVVAGALLVNLTTSGHLLPSLLIAAGNGGEAYLGAWLVNRYAGGLKAFDDPLTICKFAALGGAAASALAATVGASALLLDGLASATQFPSVWLTWWTGDLTSAWLLTPLLVLFGREPLFSLERIRALEGIFLMAVIGLIGQLIFGGWLMPATHDLPFEYLGIPILIWACFRFGQKGAMLSVLLLASIAIRGTLRGYGPFAVTDVNTSLLTLHAFLGTISLTTLILGAVLAAQKRMQEYLQASEVRFRQLAENIREVFYVAEADSPGMAYVSPAFDEIWGRARAGLKDNPSLFLEGIHPDDRDRVREAMVHRMLGEERREEYRVVRPDGSIRWVLDRAFPVRNALGNVLRVTGVAMDITDAKESEEKLRGSEERLRQSQKMEAVGRLAGGVAHDFNNLLTAVNGYSEVLLGKLGPKDPNRNYVEEIKKAGDRAALVTQQLLAFSRKQTPAPTILNLNTIIADLEKMLVRLIGENITLKTDLKEDLAKIKADPGQIAQVIMNLVLNGRDAMPTGGKLKLATFEADIVGTESDFRLRPQPGRYVVLMVRDGGIGMDAEVKAHLFEPFFTTKEKFQGTGLGLPTVFGILQQNRGGIRIVSEQDKGSAFYVYFRAEQETDWTQQPAVSETTVAQSGRETETILVVEDEENVRSLVRHVLEAKGYTVLEASGARDAMYVHEHHQGPIHLLLTDVVLSGKSGREIAKDFHELRPGIRIIFMSGYTDDTVIRQELEKSNALFLGKPFPPSRLLQKVREALDMPSKSQVAAAPNSLNA